MQQLPYDRVADSTRGEIRFDSLPERPYPGHNLDHGLAFAGGQIGQHFAGQQVGQTLVEAVPFDSLDQARPSAPLTLRMGPALGTLSVSRHRVFGSNVLYPLGPRLQPDPTARGEGMVALLFSRPICRFGLKVHTQYTDDLGTQTGHRGPVELWFFADNGDLIAQLPLSLPAGVSQLGFERVGGAADIKGIQILNRDPGGISIDDVVYGCQPLLG